jgi:hypothetical protein
MQWASPTSTEGPEAILQQGPGQQDHHEVGQQVGHAAMDQGPGEQRQEEVTVERSDGSMDRQFSLHRQDCGRRSRQRVAYCHRRIELDPGQGGTWAVAILSIIALADSICRVTIPVRLRRDAAYLEESFASWR